LSVNSERNNAGILLFFNITLIGFSVFAGILGYSTVNVTLISLGAYLALANNLLFGLARVRQRFLFLLFNGMIFLFLLGRQLVYVFSGQSIQSYDRQVIVLSTFLIFLSLLFLFFGFSLSERFSAALQRSADKTSHSKKPFQQRLPLLQNAALFLFFVCFLCKIYLEIDKLLFMEGKRYYEFFTGYAASNPPFWIRTFGNALLYPLCIFLATMPSKKKTLCPFLCLLASSFGSLAIGTRNPLMLNLFFILVYFFIRDFLDRSSPGQKKWLGKKEAAAILTAAPLLFLAMAWINYSRDGVDAALSPAALAVDFLTKQGVSFLTVCAGLTVAGSLPATNINYTFGPFIEYFTRGTLMQALFQNKALQNHTVEKALYGNSFSDTVSFLTRSDYLEGHGSGSSYIIELFVDFGYAGVIIGSVLLGVFFAFMIPGLRKHWLTGSLCLAAAGNVLLIPRSSAAGWLLFTTSAQFWLCVCICCLLAGLSAKTYFLPLRTRRSEAERRKESPMFERFGFLDFFSAVWKQKFLILICACIFALFGAAGSMYSSVMDSFGHTVEKKFSKVSIVYLEPTEKYVSQYPDGAQNHSYKEFNAEVPASYVSLLQTEMAFDYIYHELLEQYEEPVLSEAGLQKDAYIKKDGAFSFESIQFSTVSHAPAIKISATLSNAEVVNSLVDIAVEYINSHLTQKVPVARIYNVDLYEGDILPDPNKATSVFSMATPHAMVLKALLYGLLGMTLALAYVFITALLNPSLNRKSDFYPYEIPVIGELE